MFTPAHPPHPPHGLRVSLARVALVVSLLASAVVTLVGNAALADEASAPPFVVVVNAKNPSASAGKDFLSEAFLKKTTRWDDGEAIRPADLGPTSSVRRAFSERILDRSVAAVRSYWQQRIFSGRDLPPPELATDEAVMEYVQRNRGGVGYVSGTARLHDVKAIVVR